MHFKINDNVYMSGFLKTVQMSAQPPWHFSKKIHKIFPLVSHRQYVNTQIDKQ